jgi:hypothetical protein
MGLPLFVWDAVDLHPGHVAYVTASGTESQSLCSTRWWPDFNLYLDSICPYNGRAFSYPQNALKGINAILEALEPSFPEGFISGLPCVFLDYALLWKPFGAARRRVGRCDGGEELSSLPSWACCGWQCLVDPTSLRSSLSYIGANQCREVAGSWSTRNLVE